MIFTDNAIWIGGGGKTVDLLCGRLLKNYSIKAVSSYKTKGFYIICGRQKEYELKKSSGTHEGIKFQMEIQKNLAEKGFCSMERIIPADSGLPYVTFDDVNYVLTERIKGEEIDFSNDKHLDMLMETLADFHEKSKGVYDSREFFSAKSLPEIINNTLAELAQLRKKAETLRTMSDFDLMFLRNFDFNYKNTLLAKELVAATTYGEKYSVALKENSICHNLLKKENIVIDGKNIWLKSFSGCEIDFFTKDLAMLVNRYIKYCPEPETGIMELIGKYAARTQMDEDDYKILLANIILPVNYLKTAKDYYSKKRKWAPSSIFTKMEEVIETQSKLNEYIKPLKG